MSACMWPGLRSAHFITFLGCLCRPSVQKHIKAKADEVLIGVVGSSSTEVTQSCNTITALTNIHVMAYIYKACVCVLECYFAVCHVPVLSLSLFFGHWRVLIAPQQDNRTLLWLSHSDGPGTRTGWEKFCENGWKKGSWKWKQIQAPKKREGKRKISIKYKATKYPMRLESKSIPAWLCCLLKNKNFH